MVEFTEEEQENYRQRLKERAARQEREAKEPAPAVANKTPFKSKLGQKFAGVLDRATTKTEEYREKANYISNRAGRITKAVTPTGRPHKPRPIALRPRMAAPKQRGGRAYYQQARPAYRQPQSPGNTIDDFIHGARTQKPRNSDPLDDFISGGKKRGGKSNKDFFREFVG